MQNDTYFAGIGGFFVAIRALRNESLASKCRNSSGRERRAPAPGKPPSPLGKRGRSGAKTRRKRMRARRPRHSGQDARASSLPAHSHSADGHRPCENMRFDKFLRSWNHAKNSFDQWKS